MLPRTLTHAIAATVAGLVYLSASAAPVVCAAAHHGRHAAAPTATHQHHGAAPTPAEHHAAVDGAHAPPAGCADMGHCGVAVNGVTATVVTVQVAAPHPMTAVGATGTSPTMASFSPPTPPPRA